MKILNLYAGIGGNRKLWGNDHDITAVEMDPAIAGVYKDFFPNDRLIVGDAHVWLLNEFQNYDFIWTSPPCQSHSSFRQNIGVRYRGVHAQYADMKLYQEILLLKHNFKGNYVVENVKPYYEPLIQPTAKLHRHFFWSNFFIHHNELGGAKIRSAQIPDLQRLHGFDLSKYKLSNKRQILRNCVYPELGLYIFNQRDNEKWQ